jgi:hypothetical protein
LQINGEVVREKIKMKTEDEGERIMTWEQSPCIRKCREQRAEKSEREQSKETAE